MLDYDLPPYPILHATNSSTFHLPPLDGSLTLPELYEWHLTNSPDHPFFVFAESTGNVKTIVWREISLAIRRGARFVKSHVSGHGSVAAPIVAILAHSDTISYFAVIISIMGANCIPFPISPRNSPEALAHILKEVGVHHILLGPGMSELWTKAIHEMKMGNADVYIPSWTPMPVFDDLFSNEDVSEQQELIISRKNPHDTILILHSSGSSAFPKPIPLNNRRLLQWALQPHYGEVDLTGVVIAIHAIPMFHAMAITQLCWPASFGFVLAVFDPRLLPRLPTPDTLFTGAKDTNSRVIMSVPSFIEDWAKNPEYVEWLAQTQSVSFGGGALNKAVGDYMVSKGVPLMNMYGSTEGGSLSCVLPAKTIPEWEYIRLSGHARVHWRLQDGSENSYELVLLDCPGNTPSIFNDQIDGINAFATSDVFLPHPSEPGYWRLSGRVDAQIVHTTGEKTNPAPLETILNQDPHIQSSIFFGSGKFQAGVLVEPMPEFQFETMTDDKLAEFRNLIWPTVKRINEYAPQHSRIFKEMILATVREKPFVYTDKGTPRRKIILETYNHEIQICYQMHDEISGLGTKAPIRWDTQSVLEFVRTTVHQVMELSLGDTDDLFLRGCDSLQATYIKNIIVRALRDSANLDPRSMTDNFVYEYPTITALSEYIFKAATGNSIPAHDDVQKKMIMMSMVETAVSKLPGPRNGAFVLVTGTTGAFGCHILEALANKSDVSRIYAINRKSDRDLPLLERQRMALVNQGIMADVALRNVELIEADLTIAGFGISQDVYQKMRNNVTHVIHNAWKVDFNLRFKSFEPHIRSLKNLVDFCLDSPRREFPKLIYMSSIAVVQNMPADFPQPLEEQEVPIDFAFGTGYGESKWVAEKILLTISQATPLRTLIVRVGQLAGGKSGAWNSTEWLPSIIQSAKILKCLPGDDKDVSWIPSTMAANAIVDFCFAEWKLSRIVHLVHPQPTPWSKLARVISSKLSADIVTFEEWLTRLESHTKARTNGPKSDASQELVKEMTASYLLPFYKGILGRTKGSGEAFGTPRLSMRNALSYSSTLSDTTSAGLSEADVQMWMVRWGDPEFYPEPTRQNK